MYFSTRFHHVLMHNSVCTVLLYYLNQWFTAVFSSGDQKFERVHATMHIAQRDETAPLGSVQTRAHAQSILFQ
jgi:hypothetical protein